MTRVSARAVLFDMDGTLVDSTELVESMWTEFAVRHGLPASKVLGYAHGRPTAATVAEFIADTNARSGELEALAHIEMTRNDGIAEIPGAARLVNGLPRDRIAIVTSASRPIAELRLRTTGIRVPPVLITADDVTLGKPSPEGYLAAMSALRVGPDDAVIFEDAEAGLLAARASGARTVVVGGHEGPAAQSLDRLADFSRANADSDDEVIRFNWNPL